MSECKYENCKLLKMKDPMFWGDKDISDYCGVSCYVDDLESKLAEYREAIKKHRDSKLSWGLDKSSDDNELWEQLKEKGDE